MDSPRLSNRPKGTVVAAVLSLLLLVNLAASLYQLPLNLVIEKRLCLDYYLEHDRSQIGAGRNIDEALCKIDPVQKGLGWIQGTMDTIWVVGDFVMTIPMGFVADRYGRRVVLWLNLLPRLCMLSWAGLVGYLEHDLPAKAIIAGPLLSFLGGDCVFNSMAYSLVAGVTDDNVLRASYFGYMSAISYVVNLLGPALASISMTAFLGLPFAVGIFLLLIAATVVRLVPDRNVTANKSSDEQAQPLLSSPILKAQQERPSLARSVLERFSALKKALQNHSRNFTLMLTTFLLTSLASSDTKLLVQYISKRYKWTFASAGYLLSGKAIFNFFFLALVVPRCIRFMSQSGSSTETTSASDRINVGLANMCLGVSIAGALAISLSATIWFLIPALLIYALGAALPIFTLSLLKSPSISGAQHSADNDVASFADEADTHIFSIVMLVKTLGSLIGAPLMAVVWVKAIDIGGIALGLPYFVSSACYIAATAVFNQIMIP
ncbi:major facilitator superfamily domain-containing protein [Coniella lustricola]|uniref:Major facilitator superfamily domain-containing protein n=1 Tax=Coniella lustricola TaxID=2025994 RepID=A0A2T3ACB1_9PEZI|nr:major facilitator superfamily domain-containing protein [Coniella lustricola]